MFCKINLYKKKMIVKEANRMIETKYLEVGLTRYRLQSVDDLLSVHGIDCHKIVGYLGLNDVNKQLFDGFIVNFMNAQGIGDRSTIIPKNVSYVRLRGERYLRFEFMKRGRDAWLHVRSAHTWD
jgi:hypothetical protein